MLCNKKVCKNKKKLLISVCSAVQKILHLEEDVMKIMPKSVINNILEIKNDRPSLPTQQQIEEVIKYNNQKIVIPWSYILEPEKEFTKNIIISRDICSTFVSISTILPQYAMYRHLDFIDNVQSLSLWILINTYLGSLILKSNPFHSSNLDEKQILPKELHDKIDDILHQTNRFLFNWMNFLFCYVFFGPDFYTKYQTVFLMLLFTPQMLFIHREVLKYIHDIAMKAILYEFY